MYLVLNLQRYSVKQGMKSYWEINILQNDQQKSLSLEPQKPIRMYKLLTNFTPPLSTLTCQFCHISAKIKGLQRSKDQNALPSWYKKNDVNFHEVMLDGSFIFRPMIVSLKHQIQVFFWNLIFSYTLLTKFLRLTGKPRKLAKKVVFDVAS